MPAYYIGEHKVSNFALFDDYLEKVVPMVERFGGRYLTKAGSHEILEGDWRPNRVVIIEFPDIVSIKNWYRAPEYQPLIALRRSAAASDALVGRIRPLRLGARERPQFAPTRCSAQIEL